MEAPSYCPLLLVSSSCSSVPLYVPLHLAAKLATAKTTFKATGSTYVTQLSTISSTTVVYRCVLTTAP